MDTPPQTQQESSVAGRQNRVLPLPRGLHAGETITIQADQIAATMTPGRQVYHATGAVQINMGDLRLSADTMSYDSASGDALADGHVAFDSVSEDTHIEGTHATYNFLDSTGEFDNFQGVAGIRLRGRELASLSTNPLIFSGRRLMRLGESRYRLEDGKLTSCTPPNPKWMLTAQSVDVELGGNAKLHHAVFRLLDVPIFYAPFLTHSTTATGRHSGVLLPVISHSNIKGYILGDSFYWPAARNVNLTVGTEYFSTRGWADHVDMESLPTRNSAFGLQLDGVFDRGVPGANGTTQNQGGQELVLTGDHEGASGFRSVLDVDYLSSYLYRLVFKNTFADAINSEAISTAFTERESDGEDFALIFHRYQNFLNSTVTSPSTPTASSNASLSLAQLPSLDWNAYAKSFTQAVPLYFSWDYNAGALDRSEPGFASGLMSRLDLEPEVSLPVSTPVGTVTGDIGVRSTFYSSRQQPEPIFGPDTPPTLLAGGLWRDSTSASVEWRPPALARVYHSSWLGGTRLEHVIEPQFAYNFTGGVGDDADEVIRFDDRDILADTRELEYGFTNRLLTAGAEPGQSRELISWTLLQKYFFDPTFGGALQPGARNVFLTTALLSPFAVEALPLRFSPLSSVVRVSPFTRFDGEWRLDYDSHDHQVSASAFTGNFHFGKGFFSGSEYFLRPPPGTSSLATPTQFDQLRLGGGYGDAQARGYSLATAVAYDIRSGQLQYATIETSRNWDCIGISFEYRRFALANVRRENQYLISVNLANVATFGNLKRQSSLF